MRRRLTHHRHRRKGRLIDDFCKEYGYSIEKYKPILMDMLRGLKEYPESGDAAYIMFPGFIYFKLRLSVDKLKNHDQEIYRKLGESLERKNAKWKERNEKYLKSNAHNYKKWKKRDSSD